MPDDFEIPTCRKCARLLLFIKKRILGVRNTYGICVLDERFLYSCPVTQGVFGTFRTAHDQRVFDQDANEYPYNEIV